MITNWIQLGLVAVLLIGFIDGDDEVKQILARCCTAGEELAERGETCSDLNPPLDVVPPEMISSCLFSSEICCAAKIRIEDCKSGVLAAQNGNDCHGNVTDFYTSCCESCKIGMVIGASENECDPQVFQFGIPFDDAYTYCCRDAKVQGVFYMPEGDHNICGKFDRLCSQICVNTDDSYVCKCEPGFILLDDKITCELIESTTETLDNEVFGNHTEDCETGYERLSGKDECTDIDECENGDVVTCNIESQVCFNTPGSYKCLDILSGASAADAAKNCSPGFRRNTKTDECEDINECLEQIDNCNPNTQLCLNNNGGFECQNRVHKSCASGFQFDDVLKECQDIDECEVDKPCPKNSVCMNTPGGFECVAIKPSKSPLVNELITSKKHRVSCAEGFKHYFDKCIDIDECNAGTHSCDSNQNCINLPGGFQCNCKLGFSQDKVTNACIDINECQINNHDCLDTQRCDNTIGSYTCIRLQSCGTGYTLNAGTGTCDDDDECELNRHNCVKPYECRNTKGSFRCDRPRPTTTQRPTTQMSTTKMSPPSRPTPYPPRVYQSQQYRVQTTSTPLTTSYARNEDYDRYLGPCNVGFERNSQGACADIDECYLPNSCHRNQRCINTNGSYRCINLLTCSGGYTSNVEGTKCIDIDECANGEARCASDQTCLNKPGGYTCSCPAGHIFKDRRCEDINECEFYKGQVCPVNTECMNTVGSYRCECNAGFKKIHETDKVCVDIDECTDIQGLCAQRCINFWGSYRCACETGYQLSYNNRTCDDIDECEVHKAYNLCIGICENTPGSFRCNCPEGYRLGSDNRSCQDIDECETGNYCRGHNEICTNVRGSYRCTQIQCPNEYIRDTEKKNRCKRISLLCEEGDIPCYQKPSSYTYNFVTIVAKTAVPPQGRGLFTLKGPTWYENIDFDFKIINSRSHIQQRVDERFFKLNKMHNEVLLSLMQSLDGPQDIEIELSMTVYKDGQPRGTNVQRIFIIVSEFSY